MGVTMTSVSELTATSEGFEAILPAEPSSLEALGTLAPGAIGTLSHFDTGGQKDSETRINRLREMGFAEGLEVELLHESVFGKDPIAVRIGQMTIAMRRREANLIQVRLI